MCILCQIAAIEDRAVAKSVADAATNHNHNAQKESNGTDVNWNKTTGPFPPAATAPTAPWQFGDASIGAPAPAPAQEKVPAPKKPTPLVHASVKLVTTKLERATVSDLKVGQALTNNLTNRSVYRLAADLYLSVNGSYSTLHYSTDTLGNLTGLLAPAGSKIVINL